MKFWQKTTTLLILALLILALPASALAASSEAPVYDDKVVAGGTYTLATGNSLNGNLIVLAGVATIEEDAVVDGDVIILGGTVKVEGVIDGNLVALGGVVDLEATAVVEGDMIAPGSVVRRDPDAQIDGQIITDARLWGEEYDFDEYQPVPVTPLERAYSPLLELLWFLFQAFFLSGVAVLAAVLVPKPIDRTREALLLRPLAAGGMGLFTQAVFVAAMIFLAILSVLIITLPFTLLGMFLTVLAFFLAMGLGWFAMGLEIGKRVQEALRQDWTPALQAGFGTFILTFFVGSFGIVLWSFVGWLFIFLVASIGLGGVLMTRFGTQDYEYTPPEAGANPEPGLMPVKVAPIEPVETVTVEEVSPEEGPE